MTAASSGTVNLSSQRISFVNKIGLVLRATSDDESVTPGYMYKEINEISYESVGYSESLVEFLVDRLIKNNSCSVKLKVLKVIKHVVENGSQEFKLGIRRYTTAIQECTKFGGAPHPMHGNTPYLMVRRTATELCQYLYSMAPQGMQSSVMERGVPQKKLQEKYGGHGSVRSGGSIQGFGNTPANQSKGLGETILGGLEKLSAKMSEKPSDRQAALLTSIDLTAAGSNYQPPVISPLVLSDLRTVPNRPEVESHPVAPNPVPQTSSAASSIVTGITSRRPDKKHTPGKAGGGWGDDDDDDDDEDERFGTAASRSIQISSAKPSSIETDSLAEISVRQNPEEIQEPQADCFQENDLLNTVLTSGSTGPGGQILAPSQVDSFLAKASSQNCLTLVELLASKLGGVDLGLKLRSLQLLEALILHKDELVCADRTIPLCSEALASCITKEQSEELSNFNEANNHTRDQHTTKPNNSVNSRLQNAVQIKSAKLTLILQQLSTHTGQFVPKDTLDNCVSACLRQTAVS